MRILQASPKISHTCLDCGNRRSQKAFTLRPEEIDQGDLMILCEECFDKLGVDILERGVIEDQRDLIKLGELEKKVEMLEERIEDARLQAKEDATYNDPA